MYASEAIDEVLSHHLASLMKSHGFRRKGQRFWRDNGDVVDVLDLQKANGTPLGMGNSPSTWGSIGQQLVAFQVTL